MVIRACKWKCPPRQRGRTWTPSRTRFASVPRSRESRSTYHFAVRQPARPSSVDQPPETLHMAANAALVQQLLDVLDALSGGVHPGFRPVHAKGVMCAGTFTPSPEAARLTRAPHANRPSTPVTVRFSDSPGVPTVPDNDPAQSGPRGIAVRFHLGRPRPHRHHRPLRQRLPGPHRRGVPGIPRGRGRRVRGGQARSARRLPGRAPQREAVTSNCPSRSRPASPREAFFAITSFKFTNAAGASRHGRFRIRPEDGTEYLSAEAAAAKSPNFLFDEIGSRLARGPVPARRLRADGRRRATT